MDHHYTSSGGEVRPSYSRLGQTKEVENLTMGELIALEKYHVKKEKFHMNRNIFFEMARDERIENDEYDEDYDFENLSIDELNNFVNFHYSELNVCSKLINQLIDRERTDETYLIKMSDPSTFISHYDEEIEASFYHLTVDEYKALRKYHAKKIVFFEELIENIKYKSRTKSPVRTRSPVRSRSQSPSPFSRSPL